MDPDPVEVPPKMHVERIPEPETTKNPLRAPEVPLDFAL